MQCHLYLLFYSLTIEVLNIRSDVLLSKKKTIVLKSNKSAIKRRFLQIPQVNEINLASFRISLNTLTLKLKCIGGTAGCLHAPHTVYCNTEDLIGQKTEWECRADFVRSIHFGETTVNCEYNNNALIEGTCELRYTLEIFHDSGYKYRCLMLLVVCTCCLCLCFYIYKQIPSITRPDRNNLTIVNRNIGEMSDNIPINITSEISSPMPAHTSHRPDSPPKYSTIFNNRYNTEPDI